MKRVCAVALAVLVVGLAAGADDKADNAKKIVGKWEVTKSGSELPTGSTIEFAKDGKLNVVIKDNPEAKLDGTYKVDKDKLTVKLKAGDQTIEETVTITKLTDKDLEIKDKDGKVDVMAKK